MAEGRRVICPGPARPRRERPRPQLAQLLARGSSHDDLRQLLCTARLGRVILIGTSLGGVLGMAMGVAMPSALRAVVLNDTGPAFDVAGIARIIDYVGEDEPQVDWEAAAQHMADRFPHLSARNDHIWQRLVHNTYKLAPDGRLHVNWDLNLSRGLKQLVRSELPDLWPYYRSLRNLPVLAFRGAWSDVVTAAAFDRVARRKPDLLRVTVRDARPCADPGRTRSRGRPA